MSLIRPLTRGLVQPINRSLLGARLAGDALTPGVKALFASGEKGVMFDLTRAANLYTDSARTTLVTASGDGVGSCTDLSPNAKHASSIGSARPTWNSAGYATFDAFDDYLQTAALSLSGTNKATLVVCARKSTDASSGVIAETSSSSSTTAGTLGLLASVGGAANYRFQACGASATVSRTATTYTAPTTNVMYCEFDLSKTTPEAAIVPRVDGATPSMANNGASPGGGNFTNQPLNIGARNGASVFHAGRIYRLLLIGRLLTTTERNLAERWAAQPVGITIP